MSSIYVFHYINSKQKSQYIKDSKLEYNIIYFAYNYRKAKILAIKSIRYKKFNENNRLKKNTIKLKLIIKKTDKAANVLKAYIANNILIKKSSAIYLNKHVYRWFYIYKPILIRLIEYPKLISEKSDFIRLTSTKNFFIIHVIGSIIKNENRRINSTSAAFDRIFIIGTFIIFSFIILFFYYISKRDVQLSEQKQLFDALLEHTTDSIVVKDIYGRYLKASKNARDSHAVSEMPSIENMTDKDIQPNSPQSADFFKTLKDMDELIWQTRKPQKFMLHLKDKDGSIHVVDVTKIPIFDKEGDGLFSIAVGHDITEIVNSETKIKSMQFLYYSILKEVSLIINPKSERELFHRTLSALQKSGTMTACWIGCIEDDMSIKYIAAKGRGVQELMKIKLTVDCGKQYMTLAERAICSNRIVYNNDHLSDPLLEPWHNFLEKNSWISACACPINRDNKVWGALVCVSDKTGVFTQDILELMSKIGGLLSHSLDEFDLKNKLKEEKRNVEYLAHHDALTGLPNRLFLTQLMDSAIKRADRNKTYTAIGMIDFDDFKYINDTFGHDEGDSLLKQFADRIKSVLRQTDHMVRFGGDEFVLILEDLKAPDDIYLFISRLEEAIKKSFFIKNSEILLKISLGLTLYPLDKESADVLLIHADNAMYNVKMTKEEREKFWHIY